MFWRLEQHALLVKAGADLPVGILDPSHGQHAGLAVLEEHTHSSCWFMPCVRSAQPAHEAMRAQLRSRTAHLPVAHTVPTPTIGSFMTSSAIARRALVSYVDHGGSQHRVVQHHEQQVGQREHGRG